ncbi:MAG: hypothetical protein RAO94_06240 [Candidatus Stygibacter australis]|nr:hypothetical protein [Candidatus Stygibacter australis]
MKKIIFLLVLAVIACKLLFEAFSISNMILALTGLIVLWYTDETQRIRKLNDEQDKLLKKPLVSFGLTMNPEEGKDLKFSLTNLSKYPICCLVRLEAKVFSNITEVHWKGYQGKRFWNIEINQTKLGHFNWLDLLSSGGLYDKELADYLKYSQTASQIRDKFFEEHVKKANNLEEEYIQIELEVFSYNRYGYYECYPKYFFYIKFDRERIIYLLPGITSKKPYFNYNRIPDWIDISNLNVKLLSDKR